MKLPNDQPFIFFLDMVINGIDGLLLIPNDFRPLLLIDATSVT
jgi:hypothetical protein